MSPKNGPATAYLTLDQLDTNPMLAQRLPAELARRYHALPVAEDNGHITVVMADPEDVAACEAIASALGMVNRVQRTSALFLVRGDPSSIDALVSQVWGDPAPSLDMLLITPPGAASDGLLAFARSLCSLLHARLDQVDNLPAGDEDPGVSLVILPSSERPWIRCTLAGSAGWPCTSLLLVDEPRWPLRRLLVVVRGHPRDAAALAWAVQLGRASGATVVILSVVPPMPTMYTGLARMSQDLASLLTSETALGTALRQAAQALTQEGIAGTLRLRQGAADVELAREIAEGDYDLVLVGDGFGSSRWPWGLAGARAARSHACHRPVLLARPMAA